MDSNLDLSFLIAFTDRISSTQNIPQLSQLVCQEFRSIFEFNSAGIILLNIEEKQIKTLSAYPVSSACNTLYREMRTDEIIDGQNPLAEIIQFEKPIILHKNYWTKKYNGANPALGTELLFEQHLYLPLIHSDEVIAILEFHTNIAETIIRDKIAFLEVLSKQISVCFAALLAIEFSKSRDQEIEMLQSLNKSLLAVRDRSSLEHILQRHLKKYSFYNDVAIIQADTEKQIFWAFITDVEQERGSHPDYPKIKAAVHAYPDGIFEHILESNAPMIFDIEELSHRAVVPAYIEFLALNNMKEMISVLLKSGEEKVGVIYLFSKYKGGFTKDKIRIINHISTQLGVAVVNILLNESKQQLENRQEVLLSISQQITSVGNKQDLLDIISGKLRNLIPYDQIAIGVVNDDKKTHRTFLHDFVDGDGSIDLNIISDLNYTITDSIFDLALVAKYPIVWDISELSRMINLPDYLQFWKERGVKEVVAMPLQDKNVSIAVVFFMFVTSNSLIKKELDLIQQLCFPLSLSVSKLLNEHKILYKDNEKEILWTLSKDISTIVDSNNLLMVIQQRLETLFFFNHIHIRILNKDKLSHTSLIFHEKGKMSMNLESEGFVNDTQSVNDGIFDQTISRDCPTVFFTDEMIHRPESKNFIALMEGQKIHQFVGTRLYNGDEIIGCMFVLCESKNIILPAQVRVYKGVSFEVSTAVKNILSNSEISRRVREREYLLRISNDIASIRNKKDLLSVIHDKLHQLIFFDDLFISILSQDKKSYSLYATNLESRARILEQDLDMTMINRPISGNLMFDGVIHSEIPIIFDVDQMVLDSVAPVNIKIYHKYGIREIAGVRLKHGNECIGVFFLMAEKKKNFNAQQMSILMGVANQLAIALANILANEEILKRENEKTILLTLSNDFSSITTPSELMRVINKKLKSLCSFTHSMVGILTADKQNVFAFIKDPEAKSTAHPEYANATGEVLSVKDGLFNLAFGSNRPLSLNVNELVATGKAPAFVRINYELGTRGLCIVALRNEMEDIGVFVLFADDEDDFNEHHLNIIQGVSYQLSIAVSNLLAKQKIEQQILEIEKYKQQLVEENLYLQSEIETAYNYSEIVGGSKEMHQVFHMVSQVASSDTTVLILGETGTGKELIARAIHNSSLRKDKLMVKVNCAALPANLIESELFGHEKGSFTGAIERRIGKFELANHGSLFLDEIGELPLELQSKLLRAIQEKEIERLGGRSTIKVDVRIIVATNRDLRKEVELGQFRRDLYYRLDVFPITLPPLRERKQDIPLLASHFIDRYCRKLGKKSKNVSHKTMQQLISYSWPGNIRELEHLIERSILLSEGHTITLSALPVTEQKDREDVDDIWIKTIDQIESEHIIKVLKHCNGRIYGVGGAAEVLKLPATTLTSKIKRLGITKEYKSNE